MRTTAMNQTTATALTLSIRQIRKAVDGIEAIAITLHEIGLARDIELNEDGEEMLNRLSTQRVTGGFASALSVLAAHAQENAYSMDKLIMEKAGQP